MPTRYEISRAELAALLGDEPSYRTDQVWHGLYSELAEPAEMTTLSKSLRGHLGKAPEMNTSLSLVTERMADDGDTIKWLYGLDDGRQIETVLMHYPERSTVCISSQAGCAMACGFCATGQAGFDRQLTVGEIVEQVVRASRRARLDGRRVTNIVFMGMGEPMANYDRVWKSVERIHDDLGLGARHITISTVGVIPGIKKLTAASLPVNLAVSLHAANNTLRDELVPLNKRYPLEDLMDACAEYIEAKGRRLSFEWALIEDVNDSEQDALELAVLCHELKAHVNVIPLNPTPGYLVKGSSTGAVRRFSNRLLDSGVNVTIRNTRGSDIDAACGQLAAKVQLANKIKSGSNNTRQNVHPPTGRAPTKLAPAHKKIEAN